MFSLRLNNARAGINQPAVRPAPHHRHWLTAHLAAKLLAKTLPLLLPIGESHHQSRLCLPPPCSPPAGAPKDIASTATESRERARGRGAGAARAWPGRAGPGRCGGAGPEGPVEREGTPGFPRPLRPARCAQTLPRRGELFPGGQ